MADEYGYEFHLYTPVYHNGLFSHNIERHVTIIAESEGQARKLLPELKKAQPDRQVHEGLVVRTEDEYIKSVWNKGRAIKITKYEFIPLANDKGSEFWWEKHKE